MQQEEQVRGGVPTEGSLAGAGVGRPLADSAGLVGGMGGSGGAPLRVVPDVVRDVVREPSPLAATVPSDQLWRAAIRAAREAAALAADLRRQLASVPKAEDGPRAVA